MKNHAINTSVVFKGNTLNK